MIGKLKGIIDSTYEDHVIIDLGGVGYRVFCSSKTLGSLKLLAPCTLMIETHVREDHIHLYGFQSLEEKSAFTVLQSVSGIGTRVAMMILSCMTPAELQTAVSNKDKEAFRSVSGVGPKLAERILVELKGKTLSNETVVYSDIKEDSNLKNDAISALTNLGMNRNEVAQIVSGLIKDNPAISIDNLIRAALQTRSKL